MPTRGKTQVREDCKEAVHTQNFEILDPIFIDITLSVRVLEFRISDFLSSVVETANSDDKTHCPTPTKPANEEEKELSIIRGHRKLSLRHACSLPAANAERF